MSIPDSFLLDEVRCGFTIPSAVKQAWAAELEVLREIDRVCKKHNIQYFADWGTLLGTVRHGGFIPWDDDLDIVMKREDYNKFMTVARYDMEEGFDVHTFRNHEDCWLFMGKVVGRNTFCFDKEHLRKFHNFPYIACVDVFVLDYVYKDPEKEEERRELCKYMLAVADGIGEGKWNAPERENSLRILEEKYGKKISRINNPVEMRRYLYGELEKVFGEVDETKSDNLTQLFPWGLLGKDFQFPKEYYEKQLYLPFESTLMPVPMMYDKMLRKRYGEYCRLVKNVAGHDYPFFEGQRKNLQKVLDFEIPVFEFNKEKLFRNESERDCKNDSYKVMAKECADELCRMKDELIKLIGRGISVKEQERLMHKTKEQITPEQYQATLKQIMDLLQISQQLAIDMGNMLESILGEGCPLISLLEKYCEVLYQVYMILFPEEGDSEAEESGNELSDVIVEEADNGLHVARLQGNCEGGEESRLTEACNRLSDIGLSIIVELEEKVCGRKTVFFLPVLEKDWKVLEDLWNEYTKDDKCDVYVIPMPYYYKDYDGSPRKVCCEASEFPEDVNVQDYQLLTPEYLEMIHPEKIIIQNPYDSWNVAISVPDMFYVEQLRKYTDELIYVSPFTLDEYSKCNEREYSNMKYYVTMPGVVYADRVMVQSEKMRQIYIEKLTEFVGEDTRNVWEQKVGVLSVAEKVKKEATRFSDEAQRPGAACGNDDGQTNVRENAENNMLNAPRKKKMLYGISLGAYIGDVDVAQNKIERNLRLFEECKDKIDLTIRIFPEHKEADELRNYINGIVKKYSAKVLESDSKCYAADYDAYYGDAMPLVMEFRDAGKPAMIQDIYVE